MSRVTHNGIQILPPVGDPRALVSAWLVAQCVSADHRKKYTVMAAKAERFIVERGDA